MDRAAWNERYRDQDLLWTAVPNRFLVAVGARLAPGRALDLAAGEGRNAIWLAQQGWEVTAVDWSEVAIDKGRRLAAHHGVDIDWVVADVVSWVPEPRAFDLAVIAYLHVPDPTRSALWRSAAEAVAPGGRLVVIGHDLSNIVQGHGGPQEPAVLYTAPGVVAVVSEDLDIERAETVIRPVEDDEGIHQVIDNLVVAVRP